MGWIAMASIPVVHCEKEHCVYAFLCIGCDLEWLHYAITYFDMIVCFFFMVPATYHLWIQCANFCKNETTYERFAKRNRRVGRLCTDDSYLYELEELGDTD